MTHTPEQRPAALGGAGMSKKCDDRAVERMAAKCLGHADGWIPDQHWLVSRSVDWLGHEIGHIRIGMAEGVWFVRFDTHEDLGVMTTTGETLSRALAGAVVQVGRMRGDL